MSIDQWETLLPEPQWELEEPRKRRWTAEEYERLGEPGVLGPEERVELINGEVLEMSPRH